LLSNKRGDRLLGSASPGLPDREQPTFQLAHSITHHKHWKMSPMDLPVLAVYGPNWVLFASGRCSRHSSRHYLATIWQLFTTIAIAHGSRA